MREYTRDAKFPGRKKRRKEGRKDAGRTMKRAIIDEDDERVIKSLAACASSSTLSRRR